MSYKYYLVTLSTLIASWLHGSISVDFEQQKQPFLGFGAQVWPEQQNLESAIPELGISWARIAIPNTLDCEVDNSSVREMYRYIKDKADADQLKALGTMLTRKNVKVILTTSIVPTTWQDSNSALSTEKLDHFAKLWTATVRYYKKNGITPSYIEVLDKPDQNDTGTCSAEDYIALLKLVRKEFDDQGYTDIQICGPGLTQVDSPYSNNWVESLDEDALNALGALTIQGLEKMESTSTDGLREELRNGFFQAVIGKDGDSFRPAFITEFATMATEYHGKRYISPNSSYLEQTAAQIPAWSVRVIENGLSFLNEGSHVLLYRQLADVSSEESNFGIFTRVEDKATPQMIHSAIRGIFPEIAHGYNVVQTTQERGSPLYAAALRNKDRFVICITNRSDNYHVTDLALTGAPEMSLITRYNFSGGKLLKTAPKSIVKDSMQITIPGDSFCTLIFEPANPTIEHVATVQLDKPLHEIEGFGANAWTGDTGALAFMDELGMDWVRLNLEGVRVFDDADMPAEQYVDYFNRITEWDRIAYAWSVKKSNNLKYLMVSYGAPAIWMTEKNEVKMEHAKDLGKLWAASMKAYADKGYVPEYIELFNEPDGDWDAYCAPKTYNEVVKSARRELDNYGLQQIKIVGPGRAHIDTGDTDEWIDALDKEGLQAHASLSTHGWTWHGPESHSPEYVRESSSGFKHSLDKADPEQNKLRMLTEFLSKDYVIDGIQYGNQSNTYDSTAVDTVPFAVHVTGDLLWHLNNGFNTVFMWQLADQWWEKAGWGLMRRFQDGYEKKPIFHSFSILLPEIADGFRVTETQNTTGAYVSAFSKDNTLVVALVNTDDSRHIQSVNLQGSEKATLFSLKRFSAKGVSEKLPRETINGQWVAKLPGHSVTVAVFKLQ